MLSKPVDEIRHLKRARLRCIVSSQSQLAVLDVDMERKRKVLLQFS